jgi:uncharacterized integral membrane protein
MAMAAWLRAIVGLPVAVVLIGFAMANRIPVTLHLDPLGLIEPPLSFEVPLFLPIYCGVMAGVLVGGSVMWIAQGRYRRAAKPPRPVIR